ncbi:MAG: MotA/TolQ/ExbB proton channel family protein [Planctomycetota bacterium]
MLDGWEAARRLLEQGGALLVLLGVVSVGTWILIAWKWTELHPLRGSYGEWTVAATACLRQGQIAEALRLAQAQADLVARCFVTTCAASDGSALPVVRDPPSPNQGQSAHAETPATESLGRAWSHALAAALTAEGERLRGSLALIAALGSCAPLLGLLGTVFGMMHTFAALSARVQPGDTAAGIAQALITTQAGLIVALPIFLAHRVLTTRIERILSRAALGLSRLRAALDEG